jgi:WD40 repeat protein
MILHKILTIIVFTLAYTISSTAQDNPALHVTSATAFPLPPSVSPRIFPSPDGHKVAYERALRLNGHRDYYICVLDATTTEEPRCVLPEPQPLRGFEPDPLSPLVPISWSPDSTKVAVVGQPLGTQTDTDLAIFDATNETWTVLVEDGYEGVLAAAEGDPAPPAGVSVEVQPAWSPDGTQIAVERSVVNDTGELGQAQLSLIDVTTGDARDLTPLPGSGDAGATTSIAWSPDGSLLAVSLRHRELDAENDGVWLVNTADGNSERLISLDDAEGALQSIYADLPLESVGPLNWSPDGNRLLFWVGNPSKRPTVAWPFWLDLTNSEITAVPIPTHPNDAPDKRTIRPIQAAWSPDGAELLVFVLGMKPDEEVHALDPEGDTPRGSIRVVNVAAGTEMALGHLPLGPTTALYLAAWGSDGNAIINGYHLQLAGE